MSEPAAPNAKARRPRRWGRWVVRLLVVFTVVAAGGYYYITRPHRLAAITSQVLEALFRGSHATVESTRFNWDGTIEITNLRLRVQGLEGEGGELFSAERAELNVNLWSVLFGEPELRRMHLVHPKLSLTEIAPERFNFDVLREKNQSITPDTPLPRLPRIVVDGGEIAYGHTLDGPYKPQGALRVAGKLDPDNADPSLYHFDLYEYAPQDTPGTGGARLNGRFDPVKLRVSAELTNFTFINEHRNVLPRLIGKWWDDFQPSGTVTRVKIDYDEATGPTARMELDHVALTIPQLAADDYKARMTGVTGVFGFDSKTIRIENLVGEIEGLRYKIDGRIEGYAADAPFNFALETKPFRIPERPRYVPAFPAAVQKIFTMLTPVGWMRATLSARRETPGGQIKYLGTATIITGRDVTDALRSSDPAVKLDPADPQFVSKGSYFKFPYEVTNARGLITFTDEEVVIKNLSGDTVGGGRLTITGKIAPLTPEANVDLSITAVSIPFDESLYRAMKPKHREATLLFFHDASWKELHDKGHFVTAAEKADAEKTSDQLRGQLDKLPADADPAARAALNESLEKAQARAALPSFDLGGRCNALVHVTGPAREGFNPDLHVTIDLFDANVVFQFFKYPVHVTDGKLILDKHHATFQNVVATGLHGGGGRLVGDLKLPDAQSGQKLDPQLGIFARDFPIDELLFDVLGEKKARWLRALRLTGRMDFEGTIFLDDDHDRIDADLAVFLAGGTAKPGGGRYAIEDLNGRLTVSLHKLTIEQMRGTHGDAKIELTGEADMEDEENTTLQLHASGSNLSFSDPITDLTQAVADESTAIGDFWQRWQPQGFFDFEADYVAGPKDSRDYRITVRPAALSFARESGRVTFTGTHGSFVVTPAEIAVDAFSGDFGDGRLTISGKLSQAAPRTGEFTLTADGRQIGPTTLALLPKNVAELFSAIGLTGAYGLNVTTLRIHPDAQTGHTSEIAAKLTLNSASAKLGLPVSDIQGTATLALVDEAGATRSGVQVSLHADSLRIADRSITGLDLELLNPEGGPTLRLQGLTGRAAGGVLTGEGNINLDDGDFHLRVALSSAILRELATVQPTPEPDNRRNAGDPLAGKLSASLDLEGSWKDPSRLRGRGQLMVREGNLRGVPLAYGLLRISHLALPVNSVFDDAIITYFLKPGLVTFERIELKADEMKLTGRGTMTLPETRLNIALTTSNPRGLDLGPITDIIDKLRDQIVTLHTTGTLEKPVTKVRQFYDLAEVWKDIFGEDKEKQPKPKKDPAPNPDDSKSDRD